MNTLKTVICTLVLVSLQAACAQDPDSLKRFTQCNLGKDFQVVQVDRLPRAMSRSVDTKDGTHNVVLLDGYRVLITYDQTEPFVNLKAERLQKETYAKDKQILLGSLEAIASQSPDMESSIPKKSIMNGVEVFGIDRKVLQGGVLSIYNVFQDSNQIVVTMYLLNDEPANRKFQTIGEYHEVRDKFMSSYALCVGDAKH